MPRTSKSKKTLSSVLQNLNTPTQNVELISSQSPPHLIVKARAGTGKTTTLIEGLKILKGIGSKLTPSPQQQLVWDSLKLSSDAKSIAFVAFNSSIAKELQSRVPSGVDASTMHSLGFKAVRNSFKLKPYPNSVNEYRVNDIICEIMKVSVYDLRKERPTLVNIMTQIVSLCKMNLYTGTQDQIEELISQFNIEIENGRDERDIYTNVPLILERCKDVQRDGCIDFNDQIWLPVVLHLPVSKYDLLLVDEAQDLNRCQQSLAKMHGKRLVFVGDEKQAIYGFAGADSESLPRLERELREQSNGVQCLPLTVTRRCGKAIVEEARKYVGDFSAHESNSEGEIAQAKYTHQPNPGGKEFPPIEIPVEQSYIPLVKEGNMILCRVNAPLIKQCFTFIKMNRKAFIQGRDIARGLTSLVKKLEASSLTDLITKLDEWLFNESNKERAKRHPNENKITNMEDRAECIRAIIDGNGGLKNSDDVIRRIESLFTDDKNAPGIRLSSIHKAKGLEAHTVFFLKPRVVYSRAPKTAMEEEQEENLQYVAITRAIDKLMYVY